MAKLIKDNADSMTKSMFKYVPLSKESPNEDKDTLWRKLCIEKYMLPALVVKTKGQDAYFPAVKCTNSITNIFDPKPATHPHSLSETYDVKRLATHMHRHPSR